ncbi:MAG: BTAD domain-containing putative transcriptional regulator [Nitrospiraceae bacterium]|nr:BTAD domain-containing putative transcriptional regulator [Nitrospiraceae bacterium]
MFRAKYLPPSPAHTLERDRLLSRLAAWNHRKLVIIHGQAGQGKSTLAAEYGRSLRTPPVWYNLDAGDDDPAAFLPALAEAVAAARPGVKDALPPFPRNRYAPAGDQHLIAGWLFSIFDRLGPCLVVLDDYHAVGPSPALRTAIMLLLEATPPSTRFLLLSRTRPDLNIARLLSRQLAAELSGKDLRFTDRETADLFTQVFGASITASEAESINRLTEGWPVGLVLMHGFLASAPERDRMPDPHGNPGPEYREQVFDYLAQEVFSHLPPGMQDFLAATSVAGALSLQLMARLSGLPASSAAGSPSVSSHLRELQRRNLFVSVDGSDDPIVRYHALFRQFLQKQLTFRFPPARVRRLRHEAAEHLLRTGNPVEAANLFIDAGEHARAAGLLEKTGRDLLAQGRVSTLLRLIDLLPQSLSHRPWFLFFRAVSCRFTDPGSALDLYERALAGFRSGNLREGRMLALGGLIEACFHSGGDFRRMAQASAEADRLLKRSSRVTPAVRGRLLLALGTAAFFTGDLRKGSAALTLARDLFRKTADPFSQVTCAIYLAPCCLYHGDFRAARDAVSRGFDAQNMMPEETGGQAALFLVKAMTELFDGKFDEADHALEACSRLARDFQLETINLLLLEIAGWLKMARGDLKEAEHLLDECRRQGEESHKGFFSLSASHLLSLVHLFAGRLPAARKASDSALAQGSRSGSRLFQGIYLIASGAVHLELGNAQKARQELLQAANLLEACGASQQVANARLMLARFFRRGNRPSYAREQLRAGLSIGRERGFSYYAAFTQQELRDLLLFARQERIEPDYCTDLLGRLPGAGQGRAVSINCLGGFSVDRDGLTIAEAKWKGKQTRTLIKLLAAQHGGALSRETAADVLWPDAEPAKQAALITSLLHRTRQILDGETKGNLGSAITADGSLLSLDAALVRTDVAEFQGLLKEAQECRSRNEPRKTLQCYDRALSLYKGEFLPSDRYDDWTISLRERFRRLHSNALAEAAAVAESLGDRMRTASLYERMFSHDPGNEQACRWLMALHAGEGRRSEAVRLYERCELALRNDLDTEPEEKTKKLYRSIIGG